MALKKKIKKENLIIVGGSYCCTDYEIHFNGEWAEWPQRKIAEAIGCKMLEDGLIKIERVDMADGTTRFIGGALVYKEEES